MKWGTEWSPRGQRIFAWLFLACALLNMFVAYAAATLGHIGQTVFNGSIAVAALVMHMVAWRRSVQ